MSSFSTTGVIIINELFLHDSTDDNNLKLDQLVLHQGRKFYFVVNKKALIFTGDKSIYGPSEILASHWSSQIKFDQWP